MVHTLPPSMAKVVAQRQLEAAATQAYDPHKLYQARPLILPLGMESNQPCLAASDSDLMFTAQDTGLFLEQWFGPGRRLEKMMDGYTCVIGPYKADFLGSLPGANPIELVLVGDYRVSGLTPPLAARRNWYAALRALSQVQYGSTDHRKNAPGPIHWELLSRVMVDTTVDERQRASAAEKRMYMAQQYSGQIVSSFQQQSLMAQLLKAQSRIARQAVDPALLPSFDLVYDEIMPPDTLRLGNETALIREEMKGVISEVSGLVIEEKPKPERPLPSPAGRKPWLSTGDIRDALKRFIKR